MAQALVEGMVVDVTVYCKTDGQVSQNKRTWKVGTIPAGATHTDQTLATAMDNLLAAKYIAVMGQGSSYEGVGVKIKSPIKYDPVYALGTVQGTTAGSVLPPQVAGLLSFKTGLAGRKNRGRSYIPFPASSFNPGVGDIGKPSAAYEALIDVIGSALSTVFVHTVGGLNVNITPIIYPADNLVGRPITRFTSASRFATCRRRSHFSAQNVLPED